MTQKLLLIVAFIWGVCATAQAQTALNQVRLSVPITSEQQTTITLSSAASVAVNDTLYIDREVLRAVTVNTTSGVVTVTRGQSGTAATQHLANTVVWTGAATRFYSSNPPAGRCLGSTAYPGGYYPWINTLLGTVSYCTNTFGRAVPGYWQTLTLERSAGAVPYTVIAYRTSRTADATVVTPAQTILLSDYFIASMTYSGAFELFLPAATGLLGKIYVIKDQAGLADGQTGAQGRTIIVRGVINDNPTLNLSTPGSSTRLIGGITATSMYQWFAW